jgi:sodium/bile acid cotransporter 7
MRWFAVLAGWWAVACVALGSTPATDDARLARVRELVAGIQPQIPVVPTVTAPDALAWRVDGRPLVFVDARTAPERAVSTLPGAITEETLRARGPLPGERVVVYCTIGYRSAATTKVLREGGYEAFNMEGSILAWLHAGGELVRDGQPTRDVHVYGASWNLAPVGFHAVW